MSRFQAVNVLPGVVRWTLSVASRLLISSGPSPVMTPGGRGPASNQATIRSLASRVEAALTSINFDGPVSVRTRWSGASGNFGSGLGSLGVSLMPSRVVTSIIWSSNQATIATDSFRLGRCSDIPGPRATIRDTPKP